MYFVNTYGWDYGTVAALAAPRALMIANTDRDSIFPLDGVVRVHHQARKIYSLLDASEALGVAITSGDHIDSQELQVPTFRWMNHALKNGDESLIDEPAIKYFEPEQLRVFHELPADQRNTRIQDEFVRLPTPRIVPIDRTQWNASRSRNLRQVREKCFRAWPGDDLPLNLAHVGTWKALDAAGANALKLDAYDYDVHPDVRLRLYVLGSEQDKGVPAGYQIRVQDDDSWSTTLSALSVAFPDAFSGEALPEPDAAAWQKLVEEKTDTWNAYVYCCPRGIGRSRWTSDPEKRKHIERRFYLLGQTLDGMRVYDIRRAVRAVRTLPVIIPESDYMKLHAAGTMAGNALYATLFEPGIDFLSLKDLPATHDERGPYYLNVRRIWDLPDAVAAAGDVTQVYPEGDESAFQRHRAVVEALDGPDPDAAE
jgi:hypothetical protein